MVTVNIGSVTTKFTGNSVALNKLREHLGFKHPDAFYIKQRVKYEWDGMVWPLSDTGNMKTGLLDKAMQFLYQYEDEFEIIDKRNHLEVGEIPTEINGHSLRPYQRSAIEAVVTNAVLEVPNPRGIVLTAVNSGKTEMMMALHKTYIGAKSIVLVNNTPLYNQLLETAKLVFPNTYGFMQGKKLRWGNFMIVMAPTLRNRLKVFKKELLAYNIVMVDECDLAGNKTYETIFNRLSHIGTRLGFTGTALLRNKASDRLRNNKMLEIFGNPLYEVTMKEMEDMGYSTKVIIKIIPGCERIFPFTPTFLEEFQKAAADAKRSERIYRRVKYNLSCGRNSIMIFTKFITQTEELYEYLRTRLGSNITMAFTHHKAADEKTLADFKSGKIMILVSSLFLRRGMNFPLIQVIINASGGAFYSNPLQIMGRGVRKDASKDKVFFEDIYDKGKYLEKHSKGRITIYEKQGLTIRDLRAKY